MDHERFAAPVSPWTDRDGSRHPQAAQTAQGHALAPLDLFPGQYASPVNAFETPDERRERLSATNCGGGPAILSAADRRRLDTLEAQIGDLVREIGSTGRAIAEYQRDLLVNGLVSFEAPASFSFMPTRRTVTN